MRLKRLELSGFKSFAKKTSLLFDAPVTAIVGPNGSGKSNCAEAFRWCLGERSMKSLRGARGEDLIWNGPPTGGASRAGRATVTLCFDNRDRQFNLDFDEVVIGREVQRDGTNTYLINGSAVRHRDIMELLASVSLGASDHYIVHQGDADRILSANPRERREMIEDALGLRLYQWKIEESEKKLAQTEENRKQVEGLRREIAPHLRWLKKQAEKVEQADHWRRELKQLYFDYLRCEEAYLEAERQAIVAAKAEPAAELAVVRAKLQSQAAGNDTAAFDDQARTLAKRKEECSRRLGRLEGRLELKEAEQRRRGAEAKRDFTWAEVAQFTAELSAQLDQTDRLSDPFSLKAALRQIREQLGLFLNRGRSAPAGTDGEEAIAAIKAERAAAEAELAAIAEDENRLFQAAAAARETERQHYQWRARENELAGRLNLALAREEKWRLAEAEFRREIEEGAVLVDQEIKRYRELTPSPVGAEDRSAQEDRRRQLERLKIRLEDLGLESSDLLKEYRETTARDEFLAKEIGDLEQSAAALRQIILDLDGKIRQEFKFGLAKINERLQEFFTPMFGGGTARLDEVNYLETESPNEDKKEGIEISVNLPRKRIKGLNMLSGGERALTSIALLFAISQVNPPPFLILDETDAALDEANSRKYGEMVANLAAHSQLILITHNRETMSRASVIYGVTMGADGVSKLLSIKFDEAAAFAK